MQCFLLTFDLNCFVPIDIRVNRYYLIMIINCRVDKYLSYLGLFNQLSSMLFFFDFFFVISSRPME